MARLDAKTCKWRDVLSIVNGKNQKEVESPNGAFPIYGSGGIIGHATDFLCPENTVVLGRKGSINKPIFVTEKFWNVDTAFGLVADENKIIPLFLYYFCVYFDFEKLNTTVTIPSLTKANLLDIEISLPSLAVQRKIVNQLAQIDKLISLKEKLLSKLDQLVKARFVEMFGDPKVNPKNWPIFIVGSLCGNIVPGRDKPKSFSGNIPWVTTDDLNINGITFVSKKGLALTQTEINEVKAKIIPQHSVIMSCVGTLGLCSIAGCDMVINQQLHSFQCSPKINNIFLMYSIGYREDYMIKNASSTTLLYMNKTVCNSIPIIVPPLSLQEEFADFVQRVDKSKSVVKQSLEKLETLKKSLMQEYFG